MIGMMYLVLTAMLALNVSTDILNGFTLVDDSLHSSIEASNTRNAKLYNDFQAANADNPEKTQAWFDKAKEVQSRADSLFNYIQVFKEQIVVLADGQKRVDQLKAEGKDPTMHIEGNSNLDVTGQYAIVQGNGTILKELVAYYRDYAAGLAENDAELRNAIQTALATERGYNAHEKDSCDWEVAVFDGMPVGASITILTKMQNDVRTTEGQLIQYLRDQTDAGDLRVNKVSAYVIPKSNYVIRGGKYEARIIMAAVDTTKTPEFFVEGQRINSHGLYEANALSVGQKKYSGWIAYQDPATGERQNLPFFGEYTVGEPAMTISNTELNVMYRDYPNRFSVSVPGVTDESKIKVIVDGAPAKKEGNKWVIRPSGAVKQVTIKVLAEIDGRTQEMGKESYKVLDLPKPRAFFKFKSNTFDGEKPVARSVLISPESLIEAGYGPDVILQMDFEVVGFRARIRGMVSESNGPRFSADQIKRIKDLDGGTIINLVDIKVRPKGGGNIQTLPPFPLEIK